MNYIGIELMPPSGGTLRAARSAVCLAPLGSQEAMRVQGAQRGGRTHTRNEDCH